MKSPMFSPTIEFIRSKTTDELRNLAKEGALDFKKKSLTKVLSSSISAKKVNAIVWGVIDGKFNMELALEFVEYEKDTNIQRLGAEWILSSAQPNRDAALKMLHSNNDDVKKMVAKWIFAIFTFDEDLLHTMFDSGDSILIKNAKKWMLRERNGMNVYVIKNIGEKTSIIHEGALVKDVEFPEDILELIKQVPFDIIIEGRKCILSKQMGWQFIIDDISQISNNNLHNQVVDIQARQEILKVFIDEQGWTNPLGKIVYYRNFEEYLRSPLMNHG